MSEILVALCRGDRGDLLSGLLLDKSPPVRLRGQPEADLLVLLLRGLMIADL